MYLAKMGLQCVGRLRFSTLALFFIRSTSLKYLYTFPHQVSQLPRHARRLVSLGSGLSGYILHPLLLSNDLTIAKSGSNCCGEIPYDLESLHGC
jgi:hypothetical protein